jgi:hypothetical protein
MVIILGKIDHKTRNMQFPLIRATYYCSLFYLEHFVKRCMQILLVLTKKDQFEAFWSKKWDLSKNAHFFGLFIV